MKARWWIAGGLALVVLGFGAVAVKDYVVLHIVG